MLICITGSAHEKSGVWYGPLKFCMLYRNILHVNKSIKYKSRMNRCVTRSIGIIKLLKFKFVCQ